MKYIMENALEIVLSALLVAFLIFILVAGNINGERGFWGALRNNPFNRDGEEDTLGLNTEKDVSITDDALSVTLIESPINYTIKYMGGTKKTCRPTATGDWENLYEFRDMVTVLMQEPKGPDDTVDPPLKEYKYDKANDRWLVKSGDSFIPQTGEDVRYFYIYVIDIKNERGQSILIADSVDHVGEDTPSNVFYDDETDTIACFLPGAYYFDVKITESHTSFKTTKRIAIPFEN